MSTPTPPLSGKRYFHTDGKDVFGPFDQEVIIELESSRSITRETLVCEEGTETWVKLSESSVAEHLPKRPQPPKPTTSSNHRQAPVQPAETISISDQGARLQQAAVNLSKKVVGDITDLRVPLLLPLVELRSLSWLKNKTAIGMMVVGLFPLFILTFFGNDLGSAYWALALYFSAVWALYFYGEFAPPSVTKSNALLCFFGTGIVSITILLSLMQLPPISWLKEMSQSGDIFTRFLGQLGGTAIPEEICKALVLFFLIYKSKDKLHPNTLLFYGLISGLGFGIYEGVSYQMGLNARFADSVGEYYLLNVLRLTSAPFGHAIYTGIAGYFLGLSALYPSRKHGLIFLAIMIPSVFHALGNSLGGYFMLTFDALAVLTLLVYMAKSEEFEKVLQADNAGQPTSPNTTT